MRILVLGTTETLTKNPAYYQEYADFARASMAGDTESIVELSLFDDLCIAIGDGEFTIRCLNNQRELQEYDLILVRGLYFRNYIDVLKTVSTYAELHHVAIVNNFSSYRSGSKLDQAVTFYLEKIKTPRTVVVTKGVCQEEVAETNIAFPCIMKATLGAHGTDNHVVNDWNEVRAIQGAKPELRFLLQQLIPNEGDYRLLIIGENMIAIKRQAEAGSHLNNTSQGGSATLTPLEALPASLLAEARRLAKKLAIATAGVDVIQDKRTDEYYFLEINSQPQLVSGAFPDAKLELFTQYLRSL